MGKAHWAGRSREVWFVRTYRRDNLAAVVMELNRRPKAILFVPTEVGSGRWQEAVKNLVLALETTLLLDETTIDFDTAYVESRIVDAGLASNSTGYHQTKKRAGRAANIELLTKEIIAHLRAAKNYAYAKKELTGQPELLPRPTQKSLGKRVGLSDSDVSRCLNDPTARELKLYWDTAGDLDHIMNWKRPISKGRKA